MDTVKISLLIIVGLCAVAGGAFLWWASGSSTAMSEALSYQRTDSDVQFLKNDLLIFKAKPKEETGIIFYPGGKVDPNAYSPLAYNLAKNGYTTIITPMPLNLAVFASDKAKEVIDKFPEIKSWYLIGHSLGGAMASSYGRKDKNIMGIIFLASYPAEDISKTDLKVLSIHAENDGLATIQKVEENKKNNPPSTEYVLIKGGNHAQFGYYGTQDGDKPAEISRDEQQKQTLEAIIKFLKK